MPAEPTQITKVLVANRGEIARRVFSACRRMGIGTVAVYSEPDAGAPFVHDADEAVPLGGTAAADSYLRADALIDAASRTGADAVHPGYGFLAENAEFARAVGEAGLVWIGPPPEAIEAMGSKVRARAMMEQADVPVLPGAELGAGSDSAAEAEGIGFPLLVKASAGGGGKGMRTVADAGDLAAAVEGAEREAESAFGDATVFLERLLERPRHVEIQVFADSHGNTVSLGERECSIQRRHQKVVEEAPSPVVDPELRERMGAAAVAAAEAVSYVGAGTVEFLLGPDGEFFFLEMNTRLQVEHPVTEMVTGLDLVRLQLLIAAGGELPAEARSVTPQGHAVEVRLYAEDAAADFLPQTGVLADFDFGAAVEFAPPGDGGEGESGVRVDSGVGPGSEISPHYDPMLAKVIAWAPTREEAAARLATALADAEVPGPVNNRDFLVRVLRHPAFIAGETDTGFLGRHEGLAEPLAGPEAERLHAAAAALASRDEIPGADERAPLEGAPRGWRNNPGVPQRRSYESAGGRELSVEYRLGREGLELSVGGEALEGPALAGEPITTGEDGRGHLDLEVAGVLRSITVLRSGGWAYVSSALGHSSLRELPRYPSDEDAAAEGALVAPMPGKVIKLLAAEGDRVESGSPVAVLEAMKMEHELTAPVAGALTELRVGEGDQVEAGAILGVIDESD
ncbi:MAG TPA: biotin carboxylase N-terminal domain-containing protein [Solirubrobacterales bacterium]|nr:biotin carboxylase N-terminal domain-containing protein [Solirubrobacterales bacterium]